MCKLCSIFVVVVAFVEPHWLEVLMGLLVNYGMSGHHTSCLWDLVWIYCLGLDGVQGNEKVDRLAIKGRYREKGIGEKCRRQV